MANIFPKWPYIPGCAGSVWQSCISIRTRRLHRRSSVSIDQFEKLVSEFVVEDEFKPVLDIFSAFGLADAGMQESKVFHVLQDFLDSVAILVEWSSHLLEVPGVERACP